MPKTRHAPVCEPCKLACSGSFLTGGRMPHLQVYAEEAELSGCETTLIAALTNAVVAIYGEWVRPEVDVRLFGMPRGRWAVGGKPAETPSVAITYGIHEDVFARPDAEQVIGRLIGAITEAVVGAIGESVRPRVTIEFVGAPAGRTAVAGELAR